MVNGTSSHVDMYNKHIELSFFKEYTVLDFSGL